MNEKELLQRALSEIKSLRNQNQLMAARLDMFDAVMSALHGQPARQNGGLMSPDIVFEIETHLRVTDSKEKEEPTFTKKRKERDDRDVQGEAEQRAY